MRAGSSIARRLSSSTSIGVGSTLSLALEDKFCARTYSPLPFVIARAQGVMTWSPEGTQRMDFLSAFSAVNQGHCHPVRGPCALAASRAAHAPRQPTPADPTPTLPSPPSLARAAQKIIEALVSQASRVTLVSRAFHSDSLGPYAQLLCETLGYERMLPQNSGVEGWEVALKLARKWAYTTRRVAPDKAVVLFPEGNFGGRTLAAVSASTDPASYGGYGPLLPGIRHVPFGDARAVAAALAADPNVIAFYTEPIQGEAGIVLPPPGYLADVKRACEQHGALLIADEVQTGLGRTGALLASWGAGGFAPGGPTAPPEAVRPDIVVLGKALGGGVLPVSAVLADDAVMLTIRPGEHGSTFGGNPLAAAVAAASLRVILEERLCENAAARGRELLAGYAALAAAHPTLFKEARGVGLMHALEMREGAHDALGAPLSALDVCLALGRAGEAHGAPLGLLTKPTHGSTIRLTPPLVITRAQAALALEVLGSVVGQLAAGGAARAGGGSGRRQLW